MENVQRRGTKYVLSSYDLSYKERLISLELLPLSLRREYIDLNFLYNCHNDLVDFRFDDMFKFVDINRYNNVRHRYDELMLCVNRITSENYTKFYTNHVLHRWNMLPLDIRSLDLSDMGYSTPFKGNLNTGCTYSFKKSLLQKILVL